MENRNKRGFLSYHQCRPCRPDSAAAPADPAPASGPRSQAGPYADSPSACAERGSQGAPGSLRDTGPARHAGWRPRHCGDRGETFECLEIRQRQENSWDTLELLSWKQQYTTEMCVYIEMYLTSWWLLWFQILDICLCLVRFPQCIHTCSREWGECIIKYI